MSFSTKTRVAVLRGGPSYAYDDSLQTGAYVLSLLRDMPESYAPLDVFISRDGDWHHQGLSEDPHQILSRADVVWNAIHGSYGEDGQVQMLLNSLQIPFTGSSTMSSIFALDKEIAKQHYREHSIPTPASTFITAEDASNEHLIEIFRHYLHPVIVKPATGSRGLGVRLAHTFHELKDAIAKTFHHSPKAQIEEYVRGVVSTCVVIENAKGEKLYTLMPTGKSTSEEKRQIQDMARKAHSALGMRHYSSSDFIISPRGKICILETNSVPVFHEGSHVHNSLAETGWRPKDFADHYIKLALKRV